VVSDVDGEDGPVRTVVGWYAILVGIAMGAWWAVELRGGVFDRPDRTRAELGLHLAAELLTAAALLAGGVLLLAGHAPGVALVGLGMLLYTTIQSPGYFLARGERGPLAMFGVLVVATVLAIALLLTA
jgi:hypothetical protein